MTVGTIAPGTIAALTRHDEKMLNANRRLIAGSVEAV
jgi:hypothetical protein